MSIYSKELFRKTIAAWQPLSLSHLSEEDAREITENMVRLFTLLSEWDDKDRQRKRKTGGEG